MPQHAGNSSRCFNYIYFRLFAIHFGRHCHTFCGQPLHQDSVSVSAWIQIWRAAKSRTSGVRPERQLCPAPLHCQIWWLILDDFVCFVWLSLKDVVTLLLSKAIVVLCWSRHVSAQWYQYHESSPHWCDLPHCLLYFHVFFTFYRQREHKKPRNLHHRRITEGVPLPSFAFVSCSDHVEMRDPVAQESWLLRAVPRIVHHGLAHPKTLGLDILQALRHPRFGSWRHNHPSLLGIHLGVHAASHQMHPNALCHSGGVNGRVAFKWKSGSLA